jgi:uncharacterized protein YeaO (DUF488 family)
MIKVKHIFDALESDDGQRIWIEPYGLTADLRQWCRVDHVLCHLGPSKRVAQWFDDHPDGYEHFRASYHTTLCNSRYLPLLKQIAYAAHRQNFTFLHDGDDAAHNAGVALHEFLSELQTYCPPEAEAEE